MSFTSNLRMYGRFALGLPGFLRRRMTLDEARAAIGKSLAEREASFLKVARRAIFDYPRSPYRPLLALAQCELGDLEHSVHTKGLEPTLEELRRAGVYFTFEEYKGRTPVVREERIIPIDASDFDNPFVAKAYEVTTGGMTGAGTRVAMDLETMAAQIPQFALWRHAHRLLDGPLAIWRGTLPDPTGLGLNLRAAVYGGVPAKWFTPMTRSHFRPPLKDRLATSATIGIGRMCGVSFPTPEPVPIDQAVVLARWAANAVREHGSCSISTPVSLAVRICLTALDEGIDLTGLKFMSGGEPVTAARVRVVNEAGASLIPHYISVDSGPVGIGCARPSAYDDVHFLRDALALIQHPRTLSGTDTTVDAFYFTSLRPTAAKILVNVESDDYGVVEERSCGCDLGEVGYTHHLSQIRSFGKLTGEGVTLVGSEMIRILEEVLPERFGGTPLDFQLLEEEDENGLTRLTLLVSPRVSIGSDDEVVATVLEALGRSSAAADIARAFWQQTNTFRVRRAEPVWTNRGKLPPIRVGDRASTRSPSSTPAGAGTSR